MKDLIEKCEIYAKQAAWSNTSKLFLASVRRRIAKDRFKRKGPHAFKADVAGGMTVLVHPSTKREGYWQATFFDRTGEPFADSESDSWEKLVDHIHMDSVQWNTAQPMNLTVAPSSNQE